MNLSLILIIGILLIISVLSCKATSKAGLPVLVGFIAIGILLRHWFVFENVEIAVQLCNFALLIIIFTGGFQTDFKQARPVLIPSALLSSAGTALTAGVAGAFGYFILRLEFTEAMLLGAVISATDAASVFSVLSSKNLNLKNNLGPLLQMESGSNDPFAYMLTIIFLSFATGGEQNMVLMLLQQLTVGALVGVGCGILGRRMINRLNLDIDGLYAVLLGGSALLMYGAADFLGGNSFLAVYIGGIILGNGNLVYKRLMSRLFGSLSMLMQIFLFIILGLLCIPSAVLGAVASGLIFAIFLFFIARPLVVTIFMKPFKRTFKEIALVSWGGFRGASSIVFSTYLLSAGLPYAEFVFSMVFFVCLLSVISQGSLIAVLAKKLKLIDAEPKTLKPMNEYSREIHGELLEIEVLFGGEYYGKSIKDLDLPDGIFIVMLKRKGKYILPGADTVFMQGDIVAVAGDNTEKLSMLGKYFT